MHLSLHIFIDYKFLVSVASVGNSCVNFAKIWPSKLSLHTSWNSELIIFDVVFMFWPYPFYYYMQLIGNLIPVLYSDDLWACYHDYALPAPPRFVTLSMSDIQLAFPEACRKNHIVRMLMPILIQFSFVNGAIHRVSIYVAFSPLEEKYDCPF